jgi:hypothetical protein
VSGGDTRQPPPAQMSLPAPSAPATGAVQRGNTVTVIAGVGVLLLAMGVGVLIGRAGNSKPSAAPAQVISVAQPAATTGGVANLTTPTTATTPEAPAKSGTSSKLSGAKQGASAGASKGGSSGKATPAVTPKSSSSGNGKSFEEKSKSLPNVVETR